MFARLMPREGRFFALFSEHADRIVEGTRELVTMLSHADDLAARAERIATIEKAADKIARDTLRLLHQTFITPLDRNEIHALITRLDDILDLVEDVAHSMALYEIRDPGDAATGLARLCLASAEKVKAAVALLGQSGQDAAITSLCEEIDRLEGEADQVMRAALARLFADERDPMRVIKMKELYELLESVTDRCQDVANVIEGILLERA
jgi:uncharacterized protein